MKLARSSLMCALTSLVSRNAEATNADVAVGRPSSSRTDLPSLANSNGSRRGLLHVAQADGFNGRQIFARCNPMVLLRLPLIHMDPTGVD